MCPKFQWRESRRQVVWIALLFAAACCARVHAAHSVARWISQDQYGEWNVPTNWSGGVVPLNNSNDTYDIIIQQTNSGYLQVNLAQDAEINGLVLANALNVGYGSQGFQFHIRGPFEWNDGWLTGWSSQYHAYGNAYFNSSGALTLDRFCNLNLYSNAFWTAGYLNFSGYGQVVLHPGGIFRWLTPGYFGDAGSTAVADYINRGITVYAPTGGTAIVSSAFHNIGRLDVESGALKIVNRFYGGGQVRIFPQASLILNAWTVLLTNVQWNNDGYVELSTHNPINAPSELRIPGQVTVTGAGIDGAGDVIIDDWEWRGGDFSGEGRIEIPSGGRLRRTGTGSSFSYRDVENNGLLQLETNALLSVWNADLTNRAGGTLSFGGNARLIGSGGLAATRISNEGHLRSEGSGLNAVAALFYNSGHIDVAEGQLQLDGGGNSSGQVQLAPTAALVIAGPEYVFEPSSLCDGDGRIQVDSSATFRGLLGTNLTLSGTRLQLERPYRLKELSLRRQSGSTYLVSGETNVADTVALQHCSLSGPGTTRSMVRLDLFSLELNGGHNLEAYGITDWRGGNFDLYDGSAWRNFGAIHLSSNATLSLTPGAVFANAGSLVLHSNMNRWSWSFNPYSTVASGSIDTNALSAFGASGDFIVSNNSLALGPSAQLSISDASCFQTKAVVSTDAAWSLSSNLTCSGVLLTNFGSLAVGGPFSLAGSQMRLAGTISAGQSMRLTNSTLFGQGTITGNVSAISSQFLPESAASTLAVHGSFAASNSTLNFRVAATSNGVANSRISIAQMCSVFGRFDLILDPAVTIGTNDPVVLVTAGQPITGSFSNAPSGTLVTLPGQLIYRIFYGTNSPYGANKVVLAEAGTPFGVWRHNNFSGNDLAAPDIAGPHADPDGNGLSNLHEFVFAIPHGSPDRNRLPIISRSLGAPHFDIFVTVQRNLGTVRFNVAFSETLTNWVTYLPGLPGPVTLRSVSDSNELRTFSYRYTSPSDHLFVRSVVSVP